KDTVMVLGRAVSGQIQLQDAADPDSEPQHPAGGLVPVGTPSLLTDAGQQLCAVALGPDATPWVWRAGPAAGA
ncbi:hypothetical protein, partial [Streptomyces syringium]|uniref:hypothetical protein n=1 Tax=Streptomyces syringium TaxID=76729 RepID=UPI0033F58E98